MEFTTALQACESDIRAKGLSMMSFLIKPIQRICKYPLLFRELIKFTTDEDTLQLLKNTQVKIEEIVSYVNEGQRQAENQKRILDIQNNIEGAKLELVTATRRLIRGGNVTSEKGDPLHLILFNDLLLITRQKLKEKGATYDLKGNIPLDEGRIIDISDSDIPNAFQMALPKKAFTICCSSREDKAQWLKDIKNIKNEILKKQFEEKSGRRKTANPGTFQPITPDKPPSNRSSLPSQQPIQLPPTPTPTPSPKTNIAQQLNQQLTQTLQMRKPTPPQTHQVFQKLQETSAAMTEEAQSQHTLEIGNSVDVDLDDLAKELEEFM